MGVERADVWNVHVGSHPRWREDGQQHRRQHTGEHRQSVQHTYVAVASERARAPAPGVEDELAVIIVSRIGAGSPSAGQDAGPTPGIHLR